MAYASHSNSPLAALGAMIHRIAAAISTAPDSIVEDRRHAVAVLAEKSDDDLNRIGLRRDQIEQHVHRHLYYS